MIQRRVLVDGSMSGGVESDLVRVLESWSGINAFNFGVLRELACRLRGHGRPYVVGATSTAPRTSWSRSTNCRRRRGTSTTPGMVAIWLKPNFKIVCVWPFGLLDYGSATLCCKI